MNEFGNVILSDQQLGAMPLTKIEGEETPKTMGSLQAKAAENAQEIALAQMKEADAANEEAFAGSPTDELRKRLEYSRLESRARLMCQKPDRFQDEEFGAVFRDLNKRRFIADDRTLSAFDVMDGDGKVTNLSRLQDFLSFSDRLSEAKDAKEASKVLEDKFISPKLKAWREAKENGAAVEFARQRLEEEGRSWGDKVAGLREMLPNPNEILDKTIGNIGVPEDKKDKSSLFGEYLSDNRAVREYEKKLIGEELRLEAAKVMPFLTDAQKNLVNIYAGGGEVSQGVFKLMKPEDREMMYSMCQAVRPEADLNWLSEMAVRAGMGVRSAFRGAHRADIGATDWVMNKGGEFLFGKKYMWSTPEEREAIRKDLIDDIHWAESVHDIKLKDPEGFVKKALEGYADSASLQYSMLGGALMRNMSKGMKGTWGGAALGAGGAALDGYAALSMIGEQFDNMLLHGISIDQAGPLAVCGGLVDTYIESMNINDWFGKNLSAAEMKRVGVRAGFRAALKLDGKEFLKVLQTNAKQAIKIAGSEVREEFLQGMNQAGWCSLADGANALDSFFSSEAFLKGEEAFWDALPSCTAFGVFGAANPTGGIAKSANSAYAEHLRHISDIVAKKNGIDTLNGKGEELAYRVAQNEAARIANATKGMSVKERNAWINSQEGLSLAEKEFYAEHCDMYAASVAQDGQAWADAHLSGSINEAMFVKAGWKFSHDKNGNIDGVTTANGKEFSVNFVNREARIEDLNDGQITSFINEYNRTASEEDKLTGKDDPRLAEEVKRTNGFYRDGKITLFGARATGATLGHETTHGLTEQMGRLATKESRNALAALANITDGKVVNGELDISADEGAAERVEETVLADEVRSAVTTGRDEVDVKALGKNLMTAVRKAIGLGKGKVFLPVIRSAEGIEANPEEYLHDLVVKGLAALGRKAELEKAQLNEMREARAKHNAEREEKRQKKIAARKAEWQAKAKEQWESAEAKVKAEEEFLANAEKEEEDKIAAEEQAELDAINAKYEAEFKLLADEEAKMEKERAAEEKRVNALNAKMLENRKRALKEPPRLGHAKNQDGETAQRARAAYLGAWKAKMGKPLSQAEVDQLAEVYGLPPEAVNLVKGKNGWTLTDKQLMSDESLGKLSDGLIKLYGDIASVKIIVPDVVVGSAEEAANAVPNEVYDPVSDTFIEGRIVVDTANAKTLREQAGLTEPSVTPEQMAEAQARVERKVPSGKQKSADTDYPSAANEIREYKFSLGKKASAGKRAYKYSIGDRSAENVAKFYLARDIMENKGRLPDARRAQMVAKALNYNGSLSSLLAKAQAEAASQTQLLRYIASDPKTEKVLARAGLAIRNERAIERARAAAIQFSREVSEAGETTKKATERAVRRMRGEDYERMLMREGLDFNAILKAIRPPTKEEAAERGESVPEPGETPVLSDAERKHIESQAQEAIREGAANIEKAKKLAEAKADSEGDKDKGGKTRLSSGTLYDKNGDIAYGNAISDAIKDAISKAGFTLDNPEAMVQLVKAVTEKYVKDYPDEFANVDLEDVWSSPLARAKFAANLASFAQGVADAYAPSYARVRIAQKTQMLNDKGLTSMRKIEEVGEEIFRDLHKDIIRQSRESLIKDIKKLLKPHATKYAENELTQERKGVESNLGRYCKCAYRVIKYSAKECEERAAALEQELAAWTGVAESEKERIREFADKKMELEMIDMFGNLKSRMPSELEDLRDFVGQTIDESRWEVMQFGEKWEAARTEAADKVSNGIVGNPKKGGVKPNDEDVSGLYSLIGMMETKARQLTRWATGAARDESLKAFSMVEEMIQHAEDIQYNYMQEQKAKFVDLCRTCYGSESAAAEALSAEIDPALWASLNRGKQNTTWTIGRAMQMYVSCVQSDYADNCAAWGRDAAYVQNLENIINSMNPKHMEFINGMRGIYREQGDALNEVMQRTTGTMLLTPNRLYMPVKMFRDDNISMKGRARAYNPFAPSLTPRIKNGLDFKQDVDIIDMWQERMGDSAHTIAWADTGSMVQGILQSDRVLRAIREAHGDKVLGQWQRYVLDILAGAEQGRIDNSNWGVKAMRFCARLASRTWLMLNPASWSKQLAAVPCFALSGDGDLKSVARSLSFVALHPFQAAKVMKDLSETSAFKARYGIAISQEMKYATTDKGRFASWIDRLVDIGMSGVMKFDEFGVYALSGVYHTKRCELESQGKSAKEASELASSWLMHIVDKTAQTTRSINTTELQRAGGAWGILLQFKSAPAQQTQFEIGAIQEALAAPNDMKRWKRAAACVVINHLIVPTINTAIESILSLLTSWGIPDEDKRKRLVEMWIANIVSGSLGSIVFLGTIAEGVGNLLGKVATGGDVNTYDLRNSLGRQIPAAEMLNLWVNQGDKAIKAMCELTDGDIQQGAEDLAFAVGAVVPGLSWASRKGKQAIESARDK